MVLIESVMHERRCFGCVCKKMLMIVLKMHRCCVIEIHYAAIVKIIYSKRAFLCI